MVCCCKHAAMSRRSGQTTNPRSCDACGRALGKGGVAINSTFVYCFETTADVLDVAGFDPFAISHLHNAAVFTPIITFARSACDPEQCLQSPQQSASWESG